MGGQQNVAFAAITVCAALVMAMLRKDVFLHDNGVVSRENSCANSGASRLRSNTDYRRPLQYSIPNKIDMSHLYHQLHAPRQGYIPRRSAWLQIEMQSHIITH